MASTVAVIMPPMTPVPMARWLPELAPDAIGAWLRTLAAIRLVLATRLGITEEDRHSPEDPRFGIYDWLGYRLDGLVSAVEGD